jgi:thiosulfate dehydrogenase [quinone] large subunit
MSTTEFKRPAPLRTPEPMSDGPAAQHALAPDQTPAVRYLSAAIRLSIGFIFLWAFFDKLIGLDKATPSENAWLNGGSPTTGYLSGVEGPFGSTFQSMAGNAWADWLFMAGLLGIGAALVLGIGMRIAALSGGLLLAFMWAASLPLANNPFMDDHLIYAMTLALLAALYAGDTLGLGRMWSRIPIVERHPILR